MTARRDTHPVPAWFAVAAMVCGMALSAPAAAQNAPTAAAVPAGGTAIAVKRPTTPELDARGLALTKERGCTACHALEGKRVGPGFAQIAER